ncbi:MAG: hypothetical protein IPP25_17490 [Saprospiraceae bacterium]|nr:hypothetical protein [Candidatus Opimibacter skivensis]
MSGLQKTGHHFFLHQKSDKRFGSTQVTTPNYGGYLLIQEEHHYID